MEIVAEINAFLIELEFLVIFLKNGFVPSLLKGFVLMLVMLEVDVQLGQLRPQLFVSLTPLVELGKHDDVLQFSEEQLENRIIIVLYLRQCPGERNQLMISLTLLILSMSFGRFFWRTCLALRKFLCENFKDFF